MNDKINTLKERIQQLINSSVETNNHQKTNLNFLFKKLEEVKELEMIEKLKEYENGNYLKAFLFYQSIKRANYQPEHLKLTSLENGERYLEMIERDLEANEPKEKKELTNQQLLTLLGERIAKSEIRGDWEKWMYLEDETKKFLFSRLFFKDGKDNEVMSVDLDTGKIEPNPAKEFLKKHGIKK